MSETGAEGPSLRSRIVGWLRGSTKATPPTETQTPQEPTEPQQEGVTPRKAVRMQETGEATRIFEPPYGGEITPPSEEAPPAGAASWVHHEYQTKRAAGEKPPDVLEEEEEIDARNLERAQTPLVEIPAEEQPRQPTTIPEKVFEPHAEVPGEHQEVGEFLQNKPGSSTETTPQAPQPISTAQTTPGVSEKKAA